MQGFLKKKEEIGILRSPKKELLENSFFRYCWTGRIGDFLGKRWRRHAHLSVCVASWTNTNSEYVLSYWSILVCALTDVKFRKTIEREIEKMFCWQRRFCEEQSHFPAALIALSVAKQPTRAWRFFLASGCSFQTIKHSCFMDIQNVVYQLSS